jgi:hypothetical protein
VVKKMGKWDRLVGVLPRYNGNEPKYQEVVEATKRQILAAPPVPMARRIIGTGGVSFYSPHEVEQQLAVIQDAMADIHHYLVQATGGKRYASRFAAVYKQAREVKDALEEHLKTANLVLEAYNQLIQDQLEVEGASSVKTADGWSVRAQVEPYATVEDHDKFHKWCRDNGMESKLTLPWATMNALVKELLEAGVAEPDGVKVFTKNKLFLSKPRASGGSGDDY